MDYIAFAVRALLMMFEKQFWKLIGFIWSVALGAALVAVAVNLPDIIRSLSGVPS